MRLWYFQADEPLLFMELGMLFYCLVLSFVKRCCKMGSRGLVVWVMLKILNWLRPYSPARRLTCLLNFTSLQKVGSAKRSKVKKVK